MESLTQPPKLQSSISLAFFSFAAVFLVFSLLLVVLRWRRWCTCDICCAYMSSSWADEGFENLVDWHAHLLRQSPTRTIHIHVLGNTITAEPAYVEHMLKTRFDNYPKGKTFSSILGDLLGRGIFAVDGDSWLFQRKMASLELGSVSVRSYAFQIISGELHHRLLPLLSSLLVIDLQDVFRRFSFDTICKISFDVDHRCLELGQPLSEFAVAFDKASRLSASRALSPSPLVWKLKRLLNLGLEKELRRAIRLVDVLAREVIRQRRNGGASASGRDLLSRFLGSTDDEQYLRDIVISFLLAGRDTVASGLTAFFFLLSKHPHVEAKILEDISRATARGGIEDETCEEGGVSKEREPTFEQLGRMEYLHAALYESMRVYPPVQFDSRFAVEDDILPDGTFVRKGTRLTYHAYAMGRMEEIWGEDCLEFRPERWFDKDGVFMPQSPFRYSVFHAGSRICVGKELAVTEMKSVVAAVVPRFRVEALVDGPTPKFASGLTASIVGGLPVVVRARHPTECRSG
ncbi:unnamed protein product [Spirodela intermedia]|uniref:Uncharacterized protein n=1 Tax=Spirodela intermedia TaxID=51605 RepID=A0A7I8J1P3_SPIIN|nr:unnamed protein product [Spirodela intermedia]CAA6663723.1 unnamed protein product [Spirodela intermedia]